LYLLFTSSSPSPADGHTAACRGVVQFEEDGADFGWAISLSP